MKTHCQRSEFVALILIVGLVAFMAGCATTKPIASDQPSDVEGTASPVKPVASYQLSDVEGRWSWDQDFQDGKYVWNGEFVLKMDGDSCSGTLDDTSEGTFGDKIQDVTVSENKIAFRREGAHGVQNWEGTLEEKDGRLQIVDGRWTKSGMFGSFTAEKKD